MINLRRLIQLTKTIVILTLLVSCQRPISQKTKSTNTQAENDQKTIVYHDFVIKKFSDYILIPVSLSEESNSSRNDSLSSEYDYERRLSLFTNIIFYHKEDGATHLLLDKTAKITAFDFLEKKESGKPTTQMLLYKIIENDTNGDQKLSVDDATLGYLSDLAGKNLQQITPNNTQLINWVVLQSTKTLFLKVVKDSDHDKKFTAKDETILLKVNLDHPTIGTEILNDPIKEQIKSLSFKSDQSHFKTAMRE